MDEKLIPVKTESRVITCGGCNKQIRIVTETIGDQKSHVFEFQHKMIKKFKNHEILYLRDTSESTKRHYPYFSERIKVLQYNDSLGYYIMEVPYTNEPFMMTDQFIIEIIRGQHVSYGYEIVDIYGKTN